MLDDADSVPYSQTVTVSSFRVQGKEKINEDNTSDQILFFFFFFLMSRRDLGIFSCRNVFSFIALFTYASK